MAKAWLNDLNEGDIFWTGNTVAGVLKLQHCGDAHNPNFRMSRIKAKVLESPQCPEQMNGFEIELFVNQYVYDNYSEAADELRGSITSKISECTRTIQQQEDYRDSLNALLRKL